MFNDHGKHFLLNCGSPVIVKPVQLLKWMQNVKNQMQRAVILIINNRAKTISFTYTIEQSKT